MGLAGFNRARKQKAEALEKTAEAIVDKVVKKVAPKKATKKHKQTLLED